MPLTEKRSITLVLPSAQSEIEKVTIRTSTQPVVSHVNLRLAIYLTQSQPMTVITSLFTGLTFINKKYGYEGRVRKLGRELKVFSPVRSTSPKPSKVTLARLYDFQQAKSI